jgi:NADH dehydrogenase
MEIKRVCILGGSGFVGRHLVARLAANGVPTRVVARHPQRHQDLRLLPQLELTGGNILDPAQLQGLLGGCEAVINLVGILNESRPGDFRRIHVTLVETLLEAARAARVQRLLHMSALHANASEGPSDYLRSKGEGEDLVHSLGSQFMQVSSFRPSVIFGPGDGFFNRFAGLLRLAPGLFPLACADSRFQPVYVGDVAEAFARALRDRNTWGQGYDLCGPEVFTLGELVAYTARQLGRRVRVVGLNGYLSRLQGHVMGHLPGRPFSFDNYLSLQVDSLCEANGLGRLGIRPQPLDSLVPLYLAGVSARSRYTQLRRLG